MTPRPSRSETFPYPERVFILPDGVPVRYFDSDEDTPRARPAVVFIHGLGANLTHFEYVAPVLDAQGFRVLGLDLPGFGLSGKPHRRYTIDYLSAAIPALLDHVGVAQAVLFGHSLGGLCAAATAIRHRERVAALVLASPAGLFAVPGVLRVASRAIFSEAVLAPALERNARLLLGRVFWKSNVRTERFVAQSVTRPDARFVADLARVMSQARGDLVGYHLLSRAHEISPPTLVLWAQRERLLPSRSVPGWVARLPNGRLEVIAECGHMSIIEEPNEVLTRTSAFLRGCGAWPRPTSPARSATSPMRS